MHWKGLVSLAVAVLVYLLLGALTFSYLENYQVELPPSNTSCQFFKKELLDYISAQYQSDLEASVIDKFFNESRWSNICVNLEVKIEEHSWDYATSLFFAMTVVTTIGYGNVTPSTSASRLFFCFYAIIGIPLTLILLVSLGSKLNSCAKTLDEMIVKEGPKLGRIIRTIAVYSLGVVIMIIIPTMILSHMETWPYLTSFYFVLVTLLTVGFGDFVPEYNNWYFQISVGIWIFFGLAWLAGLINSLQDFYLELIKKFDERAEKVRKSLGIDLSILNKNEIS